MSLEAVQQYREYRQKVVKERSMDKLKVRIAREFVPPGKVIWLEKRKVVTPAAAAGRGKSVASSSALPQGDGLPHLNAEKQQQCSKVSLPLHLRLLQMLRGGRRREGDGVFPDAHGAGFAAADGVTAGARGAAAEAGQQEQQQQLVDMLGGGAVAAAAAADAAAGTGPEDGNGEQGQVSGQQELSTSSTAAAAGTAVPICVSNGEVNGSNRGVGHAAGEQRAAAERERGDGEVVSISLQQQQQQPGEEEGVLLPGALIASSRARALSIGRRAAMMRLIPHCSDGVSLIAGGMVVSRSMFMDHVPDLQLANLKKVRNGMVLREGGGVPGIMEAGIQGGKAFQDRRVLVSGTENGGAAEGQGSLRWGGGNGRGRGGEVWI